jgi:hypothetical protein
MDSISIENTLHQFSKLLEKRFPKEIFTTEDSIRYTFFHCLVNYAKLQPSDIILEYPHPSIPNAKIACTQQKRTKKGVAREKQVFF